MIDSLKVEARNFRNQQPNSTRSGFSLFQRSRPKKKTVVKGNLSIFRKTKGESLEFPMTQDVSQVMRIEQNLKEFRLINCRDNDDESFDGDLWLELPASSSNSLPPSDVKASDVLRLGSDAFLEILRVHFESQLSLMTPKPLNYTIYSSRTHSFSQRNPSCTTESIFDYPSKSSIAQQQQQELPICRICYTEVSESEPSNLGITFCSCAGTLQYSHLACMRQWLNKKIRYLFSNDDLIVFEQSELQCEICLDEIPVRVLINGNEHFLLDFEEKFRNHMIVRDLNNGLISVLNLGNRKEVFVGNGLDPGCDLIVQNNGVEGLHCKFMVLKGRVFVEDLGSGDGTFLRVKDEMMINPFAEVTKVRKGDWEFIIRPQREKVGFFSFLCNAGAICTKPMNNLEGGKTKVLILE